MSPDHEAQQADGQHGVHHGLVTKDRFAREHRNQLRAQTHGRQNGDVDLGMAEEPEQVLPQKRRAAFVGGKLTVDDDQAEQKSWCPTLRSSSSRIPADRSTPNASSPRMAVMNQAQQVSGMRISVMPLARMSSVVVMKFNALINAPMQKSAMLMIHRSAPETFDPAQRTAVR